MSRGLPRAFAGLWVRGFVLLFALAFGVVTTAEAAHLHRPAGQGHHLQGPAAGMQSADGEEHCPLCVAGHPALPAPMHIAPSPMSISERVAGVPPGGGVSASWHFARFSRPPPVRT